MPDSGREGREGIYLLVEGGLGVRAGIGAEVVVLERVDALELALVGDFCGRGLW